MDLHKRFRSFCKSAVEAADRYLKARSMRWRTYRKYQRKAQRSRRNLKLFEERRCGATLPAE